VPLALRRTRQACPLASLTLSKSRINGNKPTALY
jgi:hypothetical protein